MMGPAQIVLVVARSLFAINFILFARRQDLVRETQLFELRVPFEGVQGAYGLASR